MNKQTNLWTNKYFVGVAAVAACILWGSAFPVLKVTYAELGLGPEDTASRVVLAGGRFLLAALLLFGFTKWILRRPVGITREYVGPVVILGLLQTGLQYYFFYNGIAFTEGVKGAVLNAVGNFFVVIAAHFIYRDDRINPGKLVGIATGFAGIVLINWHGQAGISWGMTFRGEGFLVLSSLVSTQVPSKQSAWAELSIRSDQWVPAALWIPSPLAVGVPEVVGRSPQFTPLFWGLFMYSAALSAAAFSLGTISEVQ